MNPLPAGRGREHSVHHEIEHERKYKNHFIAGRDREQVGERRGDHRERAVQAPGPGQEMTAAPWFGLTFGGDGDQGVTASNTADLAAAMQPQQRQEQRIGEASASDPPGDDRAG